ncbi:hypothetical protein J6590_053758 [Homalodisca vitripennis]|nr:hypothetical protein J6590_053758 [Homalodisca vitripennis]
MNKEILKYRKLYQLFNSGLGLQVKFLNSQLSKSSPIIAITTVGKRYLEGKSLRQNFPQRLGYKTSTNWLRAKLAGVDLAVLFRHSVNLSDRTFHRDGALKSPPSTGYEQDWLV